MAIGMFVEPTLKAIDKAFDAGIDVSQQHARGHRQKDPGCQETIKEGKPSGWIATLTGHVIGDPSRPESYLPTRIR